MLRAVCGRRTHTDKSGLVRTPPFLLWVISVIVGSIPYRHNDQSCLSIFSPYCHYHLIAQAPSSATGKTAFFYKIHQRRNRTRCDNHACRLHPAVVVNLPPNPPNPLGTDVGRIASLFLGWM